MSARALWERLLRAAFESGDPGILFIDRIKRDNNLYYAESFGAANPCAEVPLPPYGACNLGPHPRLDLQVIAGTAAVATPMLDSVYNVSVFLLKVQEKVARVSRRNGLGITGLANAYAMRGMRSGSAASIEIADKVMATIRDAAYRMAIDMAAERGVFPRYSVADYLVAPFIRSLPPELIDDYVARASITAT